MRLSPAALRSRAGRVGKKLCDAGGADGVGKRSVPLCQALEGIEGLQPLFEKVEDPSHVSTKLLTESGEHAHTHARVFSSSFFYDKLHDAFM